MTKNIRPSPREKQFNRAAENMPDAVINNSFAKGKKRKWPNLNWQMPLTENPQALTKETA